MSAFSIINMPSQKGKVAIVTGGNAGIGYETVKGLLAKESHVIMASRNPDKANEAKNALLSEIPRSSLEFIQLDLAKKSSIEAFVSEFESKHDRLDLLINNAGIMMPPYGETDFGYERQWGVNYLAHFYLTGLLFPILKKTEEARIVTLSSLAHQNGKIYFDDVNRKDNYDRNEAYRQSKVACLIFAYELNRRLDQNGMSQKSLGAHPGVAITNLLDDGPWYIKALAPFFKWMLHSVEDAAKPTLMAALDPALTGGEYIGPTGKRGMKGEPGKVDSNDLSKDPDVGDRLWKLSEQQIDFKFEVSPT
ncbi:oxidoreductase [Portibacter marinus]|uniref:oxidoreductase n=1 Tax=Portibacter marinus TaxID=2898660 RepID=UPI001F1A2B17|nr:oxidoreductase [Portibacter marinus]